MKKIKAMDINVPSHKPPFAEVFAEIASRMIDEVLAEMDSSKPLTELAGEASMATMLMQYANGNLIGADATKFLQGMALGKTSSPVQRTESRSYVNIQESLKKIIDDTPDQISLAVTRAESARQEVIARHKTDNILRLHSSTSTDDNVAKEPDEISTLRKKVNE